MLDVVIPETAGQHQVRLKVDTGAGGNTLPLRIFKQMYGKRWRNVIRRTHTKLKAYNDTSIPCLGYIDLACRYGNSQWTTARFFVVEVPGPAVAGLPTCDTLRIVTIHTLDTQPQKPVAKPQKVDSVQDLVDAFPDQFDKIGSFKRPAKLHVKDDAEPYIDAPRKYSVHVKPRLEEELQRMERMGVIRKVDHHTDWCSSMTAITKKDGSIRTCLDPKRLNNALKRCAHKIPTLEELNPQFSGAQFFSKLDVKVGYWAIHLEKESQELTTFRGPSGRYCFQRLPFGLKVSQDIFQLEMDRIIGQVPGCICIADDVAVVGTTEEEHDRNLLELMRVAAKEGLVFNSKKCDIKGDKISFYGAMYTRDGIRPDPQKIEDLQAIPEPKSKEDLQKFLGLATYLAAYVPNFAAQAKPLRDLMPIDVPFQWQEDHQEVFERIKHAITADSSLQYYNPNRPAVVEVDASQKGLGAVLRQDGKIVAYASKSLTSAQSNYSNIERETLGMVYGITRFHTYLFGTKFTLVTDHKPLEMIWRKPLQSAPPRLQRLLVKLQGYNFDVEYHPGKDLIISDALSRLPNPNKCEEIPLDIGVNSIHIDLVNFGSAKQDELQRETPNDAALRALWQIVGTGWPASIQDLPTDLRPYWACRDELGISNGVIFKGRQVVIPVKMRDDILCQLHQGHMGIEKTRRLARESVYWPNINKDIESMVKSCKICQENQPGQSKEPLIPHEVPQTPWTKLGSDLFHLDGKDYLLIVDYTSKYPVVKALGNTRSETIASAMSEIFSLFGPPTEVMSDNGPQYTGAPFQQLLSKWSVKHTTSSPHYPRSNGLAERMVRTVKALMKKCKSDRQDVLVAMQHLRATPVDAKLPSPAEMIFGRPVRTTIPSYHHTAPLQAHHAQQLKEKTDKMKENHDHNAGPNLPPLYTGQKVRVLDPGDHTWQPATVAKVCDQPRSYEVTSPNGGTYRRNRSQIREITSKLQPKKVAFVNDDKPTAVDSTPDRGPSPVGPTPDRGPSPKATLTTRSGRVVKKPIRFADGD